MLLSLNITIAFGAGMVAALPLALPCGTCDAQLPGEPQLVTIAPRAFQYRQAGEFTRGGRAVDAPVVSSARAAPLTLMRQQVTVAEYLGAKEGGCPHRRRMTMRSAATGRQCQLARCERLRVMAEPRRGAHTGCQPTRNGPLRREAASVTTASAEKRAPIPERWLAR
jgi:formylglycine-generating enzyme required for sulfatase activity